jgi:sec-independent protein translocase protein TatB
MFDIGFSEIVLVFVIALIVLGPERLPGLARTAGLWIGKARRLLAEVKSEIEREMQVEEVKQAIRQQEGVDEIKKLAERVKSINSEVQGVITDVTTPAVIPPPSTSPTATNPPANPPVK